MKDYSSHPASGTPPGRFPRRRLIAPMLAAWLLPLAAQAAPPPMKAWDECMELTTDVVVLPSTDAGAVTVKSCPDCEPSYLALTPESQFFVGPRRVAYPQLLAAAGRGGLNVTACSRRDTGAITRLRIGDAGPVDVR